MVRVSFHISNWSFFSYPYCVMMGSSPRFNMYGNEFGMGKGVAVRSGYANKFDGKVKYHTQAVEALICKCVFHRIQ